jgi:hypothetical protein
MKKLILIIALLIPALVFGQWGVKPKSSTTITGTVTIETPDTINVALTGANRVKVDSIGTVTVTGTVTANVAGDVGIDNFTSMYPANDDSGNTGSIYATDTVVVTMGTGVTFTNQLGFFLFTVIPDSTVDSILVEWRRPIGTEAWSRWFPTYPDTNRTDGNEVTYVKTEEVNEYVADKAYSALLFDPADTNPMSYLPKSGDKIQFRFIQVGNAEQEVKFTYWIEWQ